MRDIPDDASLVNGRAIWALGYHRLCPIIPPGAPLHPDSGMHKRLAKGKDPRGKAPGRIRDGYWSGFDWVHHESSAEDVARWDKQGAGVGIKLGRGLIAFDIDVLHAATAELVEALALKHLGPAPCRTGQAPKRLLLYAIDGELPYRKLAFAEGAVEVLGEGRQFVAAGVHPVTLKPYEWRDATDPPPRSELTELQPEHVEAFLALLRGRLGGELDERGDGPPPEQETLCGDPALVTAAVAALPNHDNDFPDRESFVRVGYAIKAAMGPEHADEALDLYLQWCGRWDGGYNDPEATEDEWKRMKPPFRLGASWLYDQAEALGGWQGRAREFFEPQADSEPRSPDGYELLRLDDVLNLPDPVWLVERHIPESSLGFLYGRPGCGKSFVALDMALHMAHATPDWHGDGIRTPEGVSAPTVLYIASEGVSGFKGRARAWLQSRVLPDGVTPRFYLIRETISFMRPDDLKKLISTARDAGLPRVDLTIVDTVSRALPGADENLQKDMTLFVSACDALRAALGGGVLGVHHAGKNGDMRGSTVLLGAGDYVLRLDREEGSRTGWLRCEKQKDGPDGWREAYAFPETARSLTVQRCDAPATAEAIDLFG